MRINRVIVNLVNVVILLWACPMETSRILGLFPIGVRSHYNVFEPLMKQLAARGHQVDVVNVFPQKTPVERFTDIDITGSIPVILSNISIAEMNAMDLRNPVGVVRRMWDMGGNELCRNVLKTDAMKALKRSNVKYDAIIVELFGTDCFLGFGDVFNAPLIGITSSVSMAWTNDRFGFHPNPSFVPNSLIPFTSDMNFLQRLINFWYTMFTKYGFSYYSQPGEAIAKEFFGPDFDLNRLRNNMSLFLVNSHLSNYQSVPIPPSVIEVGGLHIYEKNKTERIQKILNESPQGVILFTFGSMITLESIPAHTLAALFKVLGRLPHTVLWKGVRSDPAYVDPIPKNIHFEKWLPQLEVLCHPNTKLFITHGGLLGTQEAIHCGVPMLGVPFYGDQDLNLQNYISKGIAKKVYVEDMTEEQMTKDLDDLLNDPSYTRNVKHISRLFRDRPMSAMDTAMYWIEHVIKYRGAAHLKPASVKLYWFQFYLLDVVAVSLGVVWVVLKVVTFSVGLVLRGLRKNGDGRGKVKKS